YLDRKPKALSGGQRQRVAIGRAIVREPKALLMDEPLSNLDAKLRNQMRAEIIKLRKRINTTFMYVTHDQTEAMTLGDRIVIMKDGFVNQIGTPQELFNCPVNLFVAGFIGTPQMNFFNDAKLIVKQNKYFAQIKGVDFQLSEKHQEALRANNQQPCDIVAGIRPEHITLGENGLTAEVDVCEMMGSSLHLHTNCAGDEVVLVVSTVGVDQGLIDGTTKEVSFNFPANLLQIFDKATGNNLVWFDQESFDASAPVCKKL
ncbi:MAG: TOBE domain-containing protein, partial [Oscillospiraceae bacterium]|nr:TOBE domain-containing protein [Oscillospiraceae bacterium]